MKKFLLPVVLALVALMSLPDPVIHAQAVPYAGQTRYSNTWAASNFGKWTLRASAGSTGTGAYSLTFKNGGYVTAGGNQSFTPFTTTTRISVGSGTTREIVTPSAVSGCAPSSVGECIVTATFTFAHGVGTLVQTGSCGVDEAANVAHQNGGGLIFFDNNLGCSNTAITTSAALFADVAFAGLIGDGGPDILSLDAAGTAYGAGQLFNTPFVGTCSGTATSSTTLSLNGLGNTVATCTSTTASGGVVSNIVGTIGTLTVTVGTAPVGASVFTVTDNTVNTTTTCTITGPATSCTDTAHHAATVAGHIYAVKFTTNASETLANARATLTLILPQ